MKIIDSIISYLSQEVQTLEEAQKQILPDPLMEIDQQVRVLRETESLKLHDRLLTTKSHINVINHLFESIKENHD